MALTWQTDQRWAAFASATVSYRIFTDQTGKFNANAIEQSAFGQNTVNIGTFDTIEAAQAACETDAATRVT